MNYHGTFTAYVVGFVSSLVLTITAYLFVTHKVLPYDGLIYVLAVLAIAQLLVQLILFLHLGSEPTPRWNLRVALFAALVVFIVVAGSIWIMSHLNYHVMTPSEVNSYLHSQDGL